MDRNKIAIELVKLAKELVARKLTGSQAYNVYGMSTVPMRFDTREDLISWLAGKGIRYRGDNVNRSNRIELQGKPQFDDLAGPMWDGSKGIRYETWELNRALSV